MSHRTLNTYKDMVSILGEGTVSECAKEVFSQFLSKTIKVEDWLTLLGILKQIGIDHQTIELAETWYKVVADQPELVEAMSFIRFVVVEAFHPSEWIVKQAPTLPKHPTIRGPFSLFVILYIAVEALREHHLRSIDPSHASFNLSHLKGYIEAYKSSHPESIGVNMFTWCLYLGSLGLIHLHTLHFMHHVYKDPYYAFRHNKTQSIVILAQGELAIRRDGQLDGTGDVHDFWFMTQLEITDTYYEGHYVHPHGAVLAEKRRLDKKDYTLVLKPGDAVIDYHIPSGPGYTIENMKTSFIKAEQFFSKHYSEVCYRAFWCCSWLSSPQLPFLITRPESHILQVAKQGYIVPASGGPETLYEFVFRTKNPDFSKLKPKTSLETHVMAHRQQGGQINSGTILFFLDDLERYGQDIYHTDMNSQPFFELPHNGLAKALKKRT